MSQADYYRQFEFKRPGGSVRTVVFGRMAGRTDEAGPMGRLSRLLVRRVFGVDLPEDGATVRDRIVVDPALAAAGGPYAYHLKERSKKLVVKIPAGMREGQLIRLAGMGREGRAGGKPGDLLLEVRLRRSLRGRIGRALSHWVKP